MNPLFIAGAQATRHAILRTISVLCVLAVAAGLWFAVDKAFIHPKPSENYSQIVQSGGVNYSIEIYNPEDTFFLGIKFWGLKFGVSKPTVKKIREITQEVEKKK